MRTAQFLTFATLLTLPFAAALGAQTAQPEQTVTTIVGCLVEGDSSGMVGEGRPESAGANANRYFVRTPAITVPPGATVSVGGAAGSASGRATTSAGTPTETVLYRITGLDREQLQPHVGHRVELRGHLSGNAASSTKTQTTVDATGRATTRSETRKEVAGVLHATTLKMVAASCS